MGVVYVVKGWTVSGIMHQVVFVLVFVPGIRFFT